MRQHPPALPRAGVVALRGPAPHVDWAQTARPAPPGMRFGTKPHAWRVRTVGSPAPGERATLVEAGRGLDPHDGSVVELLEAAGAGVGARRADACTDLVDEVLDAGAIRLEVHP